MKYKVSFARIVSELQLVEGIIEASSEEEAQELYEAEKFNRFLILKREVREVTQAGQPEFTKVA